MWAITMTAALALAAATASAEEPPAKVSYAYPAQASAIPPLKAWLDRQAAALRTDAMGQAISDQRDAAKEHRPFNPYESDRTWKVVTDTPRFLSLSLERYDFAGGAHGNTGYGAMIWDRTTQARLTPLSFFASADALKAAIQPAFCRQLDAERKEKRKDYDGGMLPEFDQCIDPVKETLILGSSNRQRFDRLGILIAPYDAGPYVEGTYEVTLPVTPAVLAAVKPEWRPYFKVAGTP